MSQNPFPARTPPCGLCSLLTLQFVMLKLESPAVVQRMTFGKFKQAHPCNLKEFKVYGGLKPDSMMELLDSGLRNNQEPETFKSYIPDGIS